MQTSTESIETDPGISCCEARMSATKPTCHQRMMALIYFDKLYTGLLNNLIILRYCGGAAGQQCHYPVTI